jgi:hypothetical protein
MPSIPSTKFVEQTVESVRFWFPTAQIILMVDGVREEQAHYRDRYVDYVHELMWLCEHRWGNCLPLLFDVHTHQAGMAREALRHVHTPTILYVEHDTPLVVDCEIPWGLMQDAVTSGELNVVRLAHESHILHDHGSLMVDHETKYLNGLPYRRTMQWSQRPHLASTDYYRRLLEHERLQGTTFIEDIACSIVQTEPWGANRLAIFHPDGGNIKRTWHTDGREGDSKWGPT